MNKQIESIAVKTVEYLRDNVLSRADMYDLNVPDAFLEKFVELIVKDCVGVINAGQNAWNGTDVPAGVALDMAGKNVKAYFGVE